MDSKSAHTRIDPEKAPRHIAIIMDGNGRWAKKRRLPRIAGHRAGVKTVDRVVTWCRRNNIEALTLYSFSSENWLRPEGEVSALMGILKEYLLKELTRMLRENIRFNTIGDIDYLPDYARRVVEDSQEQTKNNDGMTLTLALSYGSRAEMVNAVRKIATEVKEGRLTPQRVDESLISRSLASYPLPDPDLLIRTSGELRISNFLLWQIAYSELWFTDKFWPDITEEDMVEAVLAYQERERRFGKTAEQVMGERG